MGNNFRILIFSLLLLSALHNILLFLIYSLSFTSTTALTSLAVMQLIASMEQPKTELQRLKKSGASPYSENLRLFMIEKSRRIES